MRTIIRTALFAGLCCLMLGTVSCGQKKANPQNEEDLDLKYATELLKKGTQAPDFTLPSPDGTNISLSDFKGKYVVLDFWASWCPDCRKDAPEVVRAYNQFKDKGIAFVGVSFDTDKEAWQNGIKEYNIQYPQVSELKKMKETKIYTDYHINWIPSMYIIDPEGKVVMGTVMIEKLFKQLESLTK